MAGYVIDASVLLAYIQREPVNCDLEALVFGSSIGVVNFAEVIGKLNEIGHSEGVAEKLVAAFHLDLVPADAELAVRAGMLRVQTRHLGLSLGDRFCLALGERLNKPILTADRDWAQLKLAVEITLIR